jgi:mono/diheme cytochrome c family protein
MKKVTFALTFVLALALLLTACGGGSSDGTSAGKTLFAEPVIGSNAGCITCHSLDGSALVGPSMAGIGTRAGSTVSGMSAEEYLRQSIVDTNAYLVPGFEANIMPANWEDSLTADQIDELVAYLMTLK